MRLPNLTGLIGYEADGKGNFTFEFKSADGRTHYVPIKAGVLNALVPIMLNIHQTPSAELDTQPSTLTSARGAYMADGTPLLALGLEQVQVMVALDQPGAIPKLLEILSGFQSRSGGSNARH